MPAYVVRRLLAAIPLLLLITIGVFLLVHLAPGSPERALLANRPATPEALAAIRERHNLDEPLLVQYWLWFEGFATGDLGISTRGNRLVVDAIKQRLDLTVFLGMYSTSLIVCIGVPLGAWAAFKRGSTLDRTLVAASVIGVSTPVFASGLLFLILFGLYLGWFPTFGAGEGFFDRLWHLTLPALAQAVSLVALVLKITRASVAEVLNLDYVTFGISRGLSRRRILGSYILRNAAIPVITASGLIFIGFVTQAVLVEFTFGLQGIGTLLVDSVRVRDLPMIQAIVFLTAIVVVIGNLMLDIAYALIDPRVRFEKVAA